MAVPRFEDYVRRLHDHRMGDNGVFGVKAHWHQLMQFVNTSQGQEPFANVDFSVIAAVLRRVTPNPIFIYITRRNKARQAVSHWLASQTQRWSRLGDDAVDELPPYDFDGIARFSEGIEASEKYWDKFFALGKVDPLRIVYEDFVADYEGTVRRAAQYVGIDTTALLVPPPRMRKQSTDRSKEYAERYGGDLAR